MHLAHVHALPSWMETTGLSSLEAHTAAAVWSCRRTAIRATTSTVMPSSAIGKRGQHSRGDPAAMQREPDRAFRAEIAECYTWAEAARLTVEATSSPSLAVDAASGARAGQSARGGHHKPVATKR